MAITVERTMRTAPVSAEQNPYQDSEAVRKVRGLLERGERPKLACLDIDSTLTGAPHLADAARLQMEDAGYAIAFITSRTEEMVLSSAAYAHSIRAGGFERPPPHLGRSVTGRCYVPPEEHEPAGILDGDLVAGSTGTRILVRQRDGSYRVDRDYENRFGAPPLEWRTQTLELVAALIGTVPGAHLASIESGGAYRAGRTDVSPPDYRIQIDLDSLPAKLAFVRSFREAADAPPAAGPFSHLGLLDDSHPGEERYKLFVVPAGASKARAVERITTAMAQEIDSPLNLEILAVGDSFPDLAMGLFGGARHDGTLLLVGGSRLVPAIDIRGKEDFAGEALQAVRRRLSATGEPGVLIFRSPSGAQRRLIVGDLAFPGTQAVETLNAYLSAQERACGH